MMIVQCCECRKIRINKKNYQGWIDRKDIDLRGLEISHTYCPACEKRFRQRWGLPEAAAAAG
jgi:hypothetical protein